MIRAAAKNFAFAAVVVKPGELRRGAAGARATPTASSRSARARASPPRRSPTPPATTRAIARWFAEKQDDFPPLMHERLREGHRPRLRREPAPARRLLLAGRRAHARALDGAPARRQGAVVQQRARPQLRRACWCSEFEVPACAIIKHNNPCGVRGRRRRRSRPTSARSRATRCRPSAASICVNRPVDAAFAEALAQAVLRGPLRPALHRRGARGARRPSRTCASSRTTSGAASTSPSATSSA